MAKLVISLGSLDGKKTFKNQAELQAFINNQRTFWQSFFSGAPNPIASFHAQINNLLDQAISHINNMTDENRIENSVTAISQLFIGTPILYADGKVGKYIQQIANNDQTFARYLVGYFTKQIYGYANDPIAFRAIFEGMKFDSGIISNIDAEKEALGELKAEWEGQLNTLRESFETTSSGIDTTRNDISTYFTNIQTQFNDFKTAKENEFKKVIDTYDQKLALQAPVEYWSERSSMNYFWAMILGIIFFASMMIVIGNFEPMAKDVSNAIDKKNYYPLLQFASLAVLGLWLLRIIIKIFYSKLHLAEEAKEKEMFIKTYLSLLRDTDGVQDESDRHLILQSIFTPSKNGIIQDDGLPMNVIENIVKARS